MVEHKIYWTQFALNSLSEIHEYLLLQSGSEELANKYVQKLLLKIEHLKQFSNSGTDEPFLKAIGQQSKFVLEGNYKIIYQIQANQIFVTDVFHVKQNPQKIKTRNTPLKDNK